MKKHARALLTALICIVATGLLLGAVEYEGPDHQNEAHHCVTCCTNHHTAATVSQVRAPACRMTCDRRPAVVQACLSRLVIRKLDPPPKFLA